MIRIPLPTERALGAHRPASVRGVIGSLWSRRSGMGAMLAYILILFVLWFGVAFAWGYSIGAAAGWQDGCTFGAVAERNLPHRATQLDVQPGDLLKEEW